MKRWSTRPWSKLWIDTSAGADKVAHGRRCSRGKQPGKGRFISGAQCRLRDSHGTGYGLFLAADILQVGEAGFDGLRAAHMAGAFTCALYLTQRPLKRRAGRKMLGTVAVFGAAIVVFELSTWFWLSLIALFTRGASDAIRVYVRSHVVVVVTPNAMRGRVSAVNSVFMGASNELGEFESGLTAAW